MTKLASHSSSVFEQKGFTDLETLDVALHLDLKYGTTDNFTGTLLYKNPKAYLRSEAAQQLELVAKELEPEGLGLWIWDAYRPFRVQEELWKICPNPQYISEPQRDSRTGTLIKGSRHSRGCAVDLTLYKVADLQPLDMPTDFDDFSKKAHLDYDKLSEQQATNRKRLQDAMQAHGFVTYQYEWWHFDFSKWNEFPLEDLDFA